MKSNANSTSESYCWKNQSYLNKEKRNVEQKDRIILNNAINSKQGDKIPVLKDIPENTIQKIDLIQIIKNVTEFPNDQVYLKPEGFKLNDYKEKLTKILNKIKYNRRFTYYKSHDLFRGNYLPLSLFFEIEKDLPFNRSNLRIYTAIGGTTYKLLLTLVGSVISEDPEFYASLQMNLPNMAKMEALFQRSSKIWAELVENKDRQQFVQRMNILRDKLKEDNFDFEKAYQNMYQILGES